MSRRLLSFTFALCIACSLLLYPANAASPAQKSSAPPRAVDPIDKVLQAPMVKRDLRSVPTILKFMGLEQPLHNPWILVEKSLFKLTLYDGERQVKSYPVSFGFNPVGDKVREGDGKTPEGDYYICQKSPVSGSKQKSLGTRWMRLSYPNEPHAERGLRTRLLSRAQYDRIINALSQKTTPLQATKLGGGIGIHGGSFDFQGTMIRTWTLGCVGLYNSDVEELYRYVPVGTLVRIMP